MQEEENDERGAAALMGALDCLPLFPLPGTVFFPGTLLPLHVFEPRYRQMPEAVLSGHGFIGVVLCSGSDGDGTERIAGLGEVLHADRLDDGRYHLLLQGVARIELEEELEMGDLLYRRARARILRDAPDEESAVQTELAALRTCHAKLLQSCPECVDYLGDLPTRATAPGVLADVLCAAVLDEPALRQAALRERSVPARLRCATEAMAEMLLRRYADEGDCVH